jgi:UDP-N-acetylglucosamine transferase subunit ALG13
VSGGIFASVGSMLPFDRLVRAVDEWAGGHPHVPVFLQTGAGAYVPRFAENARMLPHPDYARRLRECDLFVAHAGIGSIVQALEIGRRILMLPRLAALGEHTTDHQLHTVSRFRGTPGLEVAGDVPGLQMRIGSMLAQPRDTAARLPPFAPPEMIARVRAFLLNEGI